MKLIITAAITAALAGAIGFIAGRAHQAEIDAKQAILLDSLALSALESGETHHASYYLDGSLRGNLDLLIESGGTHSSRRTPAANGKRKVTAGRSNSNGQENELHNHLLEPIPGRPRTASL